MLRTPLLMGQHPENFSQHLKEHFGTTLDFDFSETTLTEYSATTLPFSNMPFGIVYPTTTQQIQMLVRFANEKRISLYPISCGKNWGYGDRIAPRSSSLIVDLSRMNRILEVNEELGYAVIEPGVIQQQLYRHLKTLGDSWWMDGNGAGPDASLVGNILERGFGHTPIGERSNLVTSLEVVLGNGEVIETGFGRFTGAKTQHIYKPGIGPQLDGLFFQSNFGIVTRMTLWLFPKPESFVAFACQLSDAADLGNLINSLRELKSAQIIRSCVHIGNAMRSLSAISKYPWDLTEGKTPVPECWLLEERKKHSLGAWNASGGLYGPKAIVDASVSYIEKKLKQFDIRFLKDEELSEASPVVKQAVGLLKGEPTNAYLRGASWRTRQDSGSFDPLQNNAGLIWVVPTLPATGDHAIKVEALLKNTLNKYGFDVPITFTFINERSLLATSNISYCRTDVRDSTAAWTCYEELVQELIQSGYPPYRSGVGGYSLLKGSSAYRTSVEQLRRTWDPHSVISPGRYE